MNPVKKLAIVFMSALVAVSLVVSTHAAPVWTPQASRLLALPEDASAKEILDAFVGIAYRSDGASDLQGRFVRFADPQALFDSPGFNCSGFALAALRLLLREPVSLEQAKADRLGDSYKGAPLGEDWDFGWDFAFNVLEDRELTLLLPEGVAPVDLHVLEGHDGRSLRGFALNDIQAWRKALGHMLPGTVVLVDFSKPWPKDGYSLLHHHVALILPGENGERWYYHAVGKRGVERLALHEDAGLSRLLAMYPASKTGQRMVMLLETPLPQ